MNIKEEQTVKTFEVKMTQDELKNVYRLLRNEIEGAKCCDSLSFEMYDKLKKLFEVKEEMVKIIRMGGPSDNFMYKEVEITQEQYKRAKELGRIYKPTSFGKSF